MQQKNELPEGWVSSPLINLVLKKKGKKPLLLAEEKWNESVPYLDIKAFESGIIRQYADINSSVLTNKGDILVVWDGARCGLIGKAPVNGAIGSTLMHLSQGSLYSDYLYYFLQSNYEHINSNPRGTGIPHVEPDMFWNLEVPIPPLYEQHRIVSAIEALFTRLDATNEKLDKVLDTLKKFRQSVLVAACEGRLVPTEANIARKEGRNYESADLLLERILNERKEKLHINSKQQYEEPQEPDVSNLRELHEGWIWTSMNQLLVDISAGKSFRCDERPPNENEVGVVKVSSVTWGEFDENESKTCTNPDKIREEYYIREGDFLFSRANTIELVGACVIVKQISKKLMLSDKILRFNFAIVPAEWILINLRSFDGRSEIEHLATGNQKSMRNIGQDRIRQIRIPLPPLSEQYEIIQRVDALFAFADSIESKVAAAREKTEKLRQSILAKAFSGQLVETEAELARREGRDYESADILLERIKKEKNGKTEK